MKLYTVHIDKNDDTPLERAVFIKEGFSVWAALFQVFWALCNKMWLCSIILFAAMLSLALLEKYVIIDESVIMILRIGLLVFVGFSANDWRRRSLSRKGFVLFDIVSGNSLLEAKQRFFRSYLQENENK